MSKPVITIFGATGAQGGGLARALLADDARHFAVRAVTRKPDGAAAQALAARGATVVLADLDDVGSVQRALEGTYGAFFVTNFWEHLSAQKELEQAHHLAAAAAQAGVRHAIWSTLEDTREFFPADGKRMPVLQGKFNVPHFDAKGEANGFFRAYDAENGKTLWSFQAGAGVNAPPSSYEVDGDQYIVVGAGGNTQIDFKRGNAIIAFKVD